jgi:hypothetical protein
MEPTANKQEHSAPKAERDLELNEAALAKAAGGLAATAGAFSIFFGDITIKPPTTPYEKAKLGVGTCSK